MLFLCWRFELMMEKHFKAITLSFKNAPIALREMVALDEQSVFKLLAQLKDFTSLQDVLILSTCNRTEIYYYSEETLDEKIIRLIALIKGIRNFDELKCVFKSINDHHLAVEHLFRVSTGLEAQVVGDIQIANQIKRAYQASADMAMAGPFLHRLMHTIFYSNKRVVQETPFRDGAASVSYAATELVRTLTQNIIEPRILVLGVGEIGSDVVKNLVQDSPGQIKICNRTQSKAEALALECGFEAIPFELVHEAIADADIIISSIGKSKPFITKELLKSLENFSFKYFLDLSVPRSVALDVEEIPGAVVYNVDNIKTKTDEALEKRLAAIPQVEAIINESIDEFNDWAKEMIVTPIIQKLKNALEEIRTQELARYLKNMDEEQSKTLDKVTKNIMQKIIKMPVIQLKAACKRGEAESMIDIINDLFDLEKDKINK